MPEVRSGLAGLSVGSTEESGSGLVAQGRFENLSDSCRAGLRRLEEDASFVDRLAALGEEGMGSGVDESFDIDAFVKATRAGA